MNRKRNARILVIDDETDLVEIIKNYLEFKGYEVATACDGKEALNKVDTVIPSLIILDINMPKMGGLEFYNKLTDANGEPKYPVLVLTGRTDLEEIFENTRVAGFLPKPFEIGELFSKVEEISPGETLPRVFLLDFPGNKHVAEIVSAFKSENFKINNVANIESAKLEAEKNSPEYILMEYMQPEKSGKSIIGEIRRDPVLKNCGIIVYSYSGFAEYEKKSLEAGADIYLGKPGSSEELISAVKSLYWKKKYMKNDTFSAQD